MSHQTRRVNAQRRAFAQDGGELLGRAGRLVVARGEAEIVLLSQVAEAAQVVEEQIDRRRVFVPFLLAGGQFGGDFRDRPRPRRGRPAIFTACGATAARRFQKPTSGASDRMPSRM